MAEPVFIGVGEILGLRAAVATAAKILWTNPDGTQISATISPKPMGLDATHEADVIPIKNQQGQTVGYIASDESVTIAWDCVPEGATFSDALVSAGIPMALAKGVVTGFKIIKIGPFTDGLNITSGGIEANPHIYLGGAKLNGSPDKPWGYSITTKRSPYITGNTAIV